MGRGALRGLLVVILLLALIVLAIPVLEARDALLQARAQVAMEWQQVQQAMDGRAASVTRLLELLEEPDHRHRLSRFPRIRQSLAAAVQEVTSATDSPSLVQSNEHLQDLLHRLHASTESARANEDADLQRLLSEIVAAENRIHQERSQYNEAVQLYNVRLALFPANLAGRLFGMRRHELYLPTALPVGERTTSIRPPQ
ncbi:MAG: LemA family protein [Bryobacterales bacterium]|jgi:LemA protein|nr:LemA family protein [Bryobacterales bacterium]